MVSSDLWALVGVARRRDVGVDRLLGVVNSMPMPLPTLPSNPAPGDCSMLIAAVSSSTSAAITGVVPEAPRRRRCVGRRSDDADDVEAGRLRTAAPPWRGGSEEYCWAPPAAAAEAFGGGSDSWTAGSGCACGRCNARDGEPRGSCTDVGGDDRNSLECVGNTSHPALPWPGDVNVGLTGSTTRPAELRRPPLSCRAVCRVCWRPSLLDMAPAAPSCGLVSGSRPPLPLCACGLVPAAEPRAARCLRQYHRFFTALSGRPDRRREMRLQRLPRRPCASISTSSSSCVHGVFLTLGSRLFTHRSRHCFALRPGMWAAVAFHRRAPLRSTSRVNSASSFADHAPRTTGKVAFQYAVHWSTVRSYGNILAATWPRPTRVGRVATTVRPQ